MRSSRHACASAARVLVGALVGSVVGAGLINLLFIIAVAGLSRSAGLASGVLAELSWADPVYTRAALHSLADVRVGGVDTAGPTIVCLVRVLLEPGSSVLGRLVAAGVANTIVLAAAGLLLRMAIHRHRPALLVCSIAMQLQVALALVVSPPSLADLETTGASFALDVAMPWLAGRRLVLSDLVSDVSAPVVAAGLVVIALVMAYALAGVLVSVFLTTSRRASVVRSRNRSWSWSWSWRKPAWVTSTAAMSAIVLVSALAAAAGALPAAPVTHAAPAPPAVTAPMVAHIAVGDRWFRDPFAPSRVEVVPTDTGFVYRVNGTPQVIRGMGINTQYHSQLNAADRRTRIDADLAAIQAIGVNTLVGWDPAEFDDVLLDSAQRHGIGVVPAFDVDPDADYTDPAYTADLTRRVLAWVNQYRQYPSVRMWGLGNEVLHKIVHPAWLGPQDPHQEVEARAFSDWLIQTADAIHDADPNHPVTYRDAENAFFGWVTDALQRRPAAAPRTWFVLGTNSYTNYLEPIVDSWPATAPGTALWVSEFAPGGVATTDRPAGFAVMWDYVRKHPQYVFGGAVYTWTRNGPEEIDRTLGLTDDGTPVDSASLRTLTMLYTRPDN